MTVVHFVPILMLAVSNIFMTFVFVGFLVFRLKEVSNWMTAAGFVFFALGAARVFKG